MRRESYRYQRTLARPADVRGIGFLTGSDIRLRFQPAPPNTGIVFLRSDLRSRPTIQAVVAQVSGTARRTTLGRGPASVELVEHTLAALAALRIDNCCVDLDGPEPPGLDGSSQGFVDALKGAGIVLQSVRKPIYHVERTVVVRRDGAVLAIHPHDGNELKVSYLLDYGIGSPIGWQMHTQTITPESFCNELANCRTFLLQAEAEEFRKRGLGSRTTKGDLLIFGPKGVMGNRLRFANEPARHKCLDIVGDLSLFGMDLCGHVVAYRSGHPLNVELVRTLHEQISMSGSAPSIRLAA